ncbi:MAG TPA: HNH endonuclease [Candidatus Hodarchaeales archaeon]|nr:HNH endonuclease [Candidatus Hodarchaeales archaeon]
MRVEQRERWQRYQTLWRKTNPDYMITWYKNNPDKNRTYCTSYYRKHRELFVLANQRRRAMKRGTVSYKELKTLPEFCVFCFEENNLSVEHLIPISRGGWHIIENLTTACKSCNSSKNNKTVDEWFST